MNRKLLITVGTAGVLAFGIAASDANAACGPAKGFQTINTGSGAYHVLVFPTDANVNPAGGVLKGRLWQGGNRAAGNEGAACAPDSYLLVDPLGGGPNTLGVLGALGGNIIGSTCDNAGCPSGNMILLIQTLSNDGSKSYYAAGKIAETDGFDYASMLVDWTVQEVTRPRVSLSTRALTNVTTNLQFDAPTAVRTETTAFTPESVLTGYQLHRFTGTADPGRDPNAWGAAVATVSVTGTGAVLTGVVNDCSNTANDVFLAVRPVWDGGQLLGDYMSASTRIECDPNLADPRFKLIDKKKPSRGTIQPR